MRKLKTKLSIITGMFLLVLMTGSTFAQDMSGRWEGTFVWAGNQPIKDDVTYDWDEGKWNSTTKKPVKFALELEKGDEDGKYTGTYFYHTGYDRMKFEATFADSLLKGSSGKAIQGSAQWGGYVELNFREQDGKKYLEGSWRTNEKSKIWEGRVALRLVESE